MGTVRILIVTHIGETFGHLVRGLAVADALTSKGVAVEVAAAEAAADLLATWPVTYPHHALNWAWSHNAGDANRASDQYVGRIIDTNRALLLLLQSVRPDAVVGFPGAFTTQAARSLGIPHWSVIHAPYLAPLISLPDPFPAEERVLSFARGVCGRGAEHILHSIAGSLDVPDLTYPEYLGTEQIVVPQPAVPFRQSANIRVVNFIRASYGASLTDVPDSVLADACYVTFGSGNPCDISSVVSAARRCFRHVILTGRTQSNVHDDVIFRSSSASQYLAGRVKAVVSHGGIGTVGTFAEGGTPQLIIPTEIDQAVMAVFAPRLGIAHQVGLEAWAEQPQLGRRLSHLDANLLDEEMRLLSATPALQHRVSADGAIEAADTILTAMGHSAPRRPSRGGALDS